MFIIGNNFVGGNFASVLTPTAVDNIHYLELSNGKYDGFFVSRNPAIPFSKDIPGNWDFDTILYAQFNNSTNAGNVDWSLETVSDMVLKRRLEGSHEWMTLLVKPVREISDFSIHFNDYLVPNRAQADYAIVPVLYGSEGSYNISKIEVNFEKLFIIENGNVYGTLITDAFCDTTSNLPSSTVELLNSKYPLIINHSAANYQTGVCTGSFVPTVTEDGCFYAYDTSDDYIRVSYQKEIVDMLCNRKPKLLKMPDGRVWVIKVTGLTDTADKAYNNRNISFNWTEVGDAKSQEDLYYLGISDVPPEWW